MDRNETPDNAILLHACCGPCSITTVRRLLDLGFAPTLYFYNPNIHPLSEYLRRRDGLLEVALRLDVPVLLPDQTGLPLQTDLPLQTALSDQQAQEGEAAAWAGTWLKRIAPLGPGMADMALRCPLCYDLRLSATSAVARRLGFPRYSTTLMYSRYQNRQAILDCGQQYAGQGLEFIGEDFRTGWQEGIRQSKEWGIYRQQYCGCVLSEHDRYRKSLKR